MVAERVAQIQAFEARETNAVLDYVSRLQPPKSFGLSERLAQSRPCRLTASRRLAAQAHRCTLPDSHQRPLDAHEEQRRRKP